MSSSIVGLFWRALVICLAAVLFANVSFAQKDSAGAAKRLYDEGVLKMEAGECGEAIKLFSAALENKPDHAWALADRGQCFLQANDYEKALADLNAAVKFDPKLDEAFKSRGDLYSTIGKYREAIADYTRMLRLAPDDHDTLMARADAYRQIGDTKRASADEKKADKVWKEMLEDPSTVPPTVLTTVRNIRPTLLTEVELTDSYIRDTTLGAHLVAGTPEQRAEQAKIEIAKLTAVIKINPAFATAYFERANNYVVLGDQQLAIADYSKAIGIDPNFYKAFNNRAIACARTGNYERAIADLARAMTYEPKDHARHYNFGLVLLNKGSHQLSVNILTGYLEKNPNDFKAYQLRALAYRKLGKTAESETDEAAARRIVEGK